MNNFAGKNDCDMEITFDDVIVKAAPGLRVVKIEAEVSNSPTLPALRDEMEQLMEEIQLKYELGDINKRPGIAATRAAYKALGKDPNRYRPSCDAMCRRIVKGMGLYYIDNLVDLINILSVKSGYSIGGFDMDKIDGERLTLGAGREGEPFEGIGRGALNIAHLPVYRDKTGGIGTPTSDNERTKIDLTTRRLLICINIYGEEMATEETIALAERLLHDYADGRITSLEVIPARKQTP